MWITSCKWRVNNKTTIFLLLLFSLIPPFSVSICPLQHWMSQPSTTVSRGFRKSSLGTLGTPRGCQRYQNNLQCTFTSCIFNWCLNWTVNQVWARLRLLLRGTPDMTDTVALTEIKPASSQLHWATLSCSAIKEQAHRDAHTKHYEKKLFCVYVLFDCFVWVIFNFFSKQNMCFQISCGLCFDLFMNCVCELLYPIYRVSCLNLLQIRESYLIICLSAGDQAVFKGSADVNN